MKNSRKKLIENYVDYRCRKLQEQWYNPGSWDWGAIGQGAKDIAQGAGSMLYNLSPIGQVGNTIDRAAGAYNDIKAGHDIGTVAGNVANKYVDDTQAGLDILGMIPGAGILPDAVNVGVSGARAGLSDYMGNTENRDKHLVNMGLSGAAAIPGIGLAAGLGKVGKTAKTLGNLSRAGKIGKTAANIAKASKIPAKSAKIAVKTLKKAADGTSLVNTAMNAGDQGTQVMKAGPSQGIFSQMYNNLKDSGANMFDYSKSTTF